MNFKTLDVFADGLPMVGELALRNNQESAYALRGHSINKVRLHGLDNGDLDAQFAYAIYMASRTAGRVEYEVVKAQESLQ